MSENRDLAVEIVQKTLENPKNAAVIGSSTAGVAWFDMGDLAMFLGICLTAVSLYNQIMIAVRNRKNK